ncbi:MAG TPA: polyphosphate kinase 2 [Methylomirabilota bacterium]|nr:polyphosphate kinase 2 [Methylomirabilota bacterium]
MADVAANRRLVSAANRLIASPRDSEATVEERDSMGKKQKGNRASAGAIDGDKIDVRLAAEDPDSLAEREGAAVLSTHAPEAPEICVDETSFDLDEPVFPDAIKAAALASGGYPYEDSIKDKVYADQLRLLQIELVKLQKWVNDTGARLVLLFEGRDAAGKGGSIGTFRRYMNPRSARDVALPKPSETERGQWYFQRYVAQLPTAGEIVMFDRSWYNRAGVERVMGFCTEEEAEAFLDEVGSFEAMLVREGIVLVKFWLDIGREMQLKRFHDRRHDPLKVWKLSPVDIKALGMWDEYSRARDRMFEASHTSIAPWTVLRANDKKRARLNAIRHVLKLLDYDGKTPEAIGETDPNIIGSGPDILKAPPRRPG